MARLFFLFFFSFFSQAEDISHENNEYNKCIVNAVFQEAFLTQECLMYVQRKENVQAETNGSFEECYKSRAIAIVVQIENCRNKLEEK